MNISKRVLHVFHYTSGFERFLMSTFMYAFFKADFFAYKGPLSE